MEIGECPADVPCMSRDTYLPLDTLLRSDWMIELTKPLPEPS